jgi:hypothetical protein
MSGHTNKGKPNDGTSLWDMFQERMRDRGWTIETLSLMMALPAGTWDKMILDPDRYENAAVKQHYLTDEVRREFDLNFLTLQLIGTMKDDHRVILGRSTAEALERAFAVPAQVWIDRQDNHRKWLIRNMVN